MSASTAEAQKSPKAAKTKKAVDHPAYSEMIKSAITALNEKKGSSRQAIVKYIREHYSVGSDAKNINLHVVKALKKTTENGTLKQVSGTGGSGSFKLPKTLKAPKKSTPTEPRKALSSEKKQSTSAKSPKKTSVKKKTPTSTSKSAGKPYKKAATAKPKKTVSSEKKQSTSAKTPKKTAVKKKTPTSMSKAAGKPPKKAATAVPKI